MTTTLTDRYVWAVTRLLPEGQRAEIDQELRSSIGDMVDARLAAAGEDPRVPEDDDVTVDDVEAEVLTELGDPGALAARYTDRPRALIGPEVYPGYLRLLKLLASILLPIVAVTSLVVGILAEDVTGIGEVIGGVASGLFDVALQLTFWVTLGYVIYERTRGEDHWSVDALPDPPAPRHVTVGETVSSLVLVGVAIAALLWQRASSPLTDPVDGEAVPLLDPGLWSGWAQALIAVLALGAVVVVVVHRVGRWTPATAAANVGVDLVVLGIVTWLAVDDRLLNTRFLEVLADRNDWTSVPDPSPWAVIVLVGAVVAWDAVDGLRKARRARDLSVGPGRALP